MATIIKNIETTLNDSQLKTLKRISNWALNGRNPFYGDRYEVKSEEITYMEGAVYVSVTFGMKGDEGTMAEFICRDRYGFFIGERGGIFYYGPKSHSPKYIKLNQLYSIKW